MTTMFPNTEALRPIMLAVAKHYDLDLEELRTKQRDARRVHARRMAIGVLRRIYPQMSSVQISRLFGRDDHTWVLYHVQQLNDLLMTDPSIVRDLETLVSLFTTQPTKGDS